MSGTGSPTEDSQWYVARDGQQHGPLTDAEMRLFVQGGHLKPTDLIWKAGFPDWKPAPAVFPPKGNLDDVLTAPAATDPAAPNGEEVSEKVSDESNPQSKAAGTEKDLSEHIETTASSKATKQTDLKNAEAAEKQAESGKNAKAGNDHTNPFDPNAWKKEKAASESGSEKLAEKRSGQAYSRQPDQMDPRLQQPSTASRNPTGEPRSSSHRPASPIGQQPTGRVAQNQPGAQHGNLHAHRPGGDIPTGPVISVPTQDRLSDDDHEHHEGRAALGRIAAVITGLVVLSGLGYVAYDRREQIVEVYNSTASSIASATDDSSDPGPPVIRAEPVKARSGSPAKTAALDDSVLNSTTIGAGTETPTLAPASPADPVKALDADFEKSQLWSLIKREFPDWYGERLREVADMSANRSETDVSAHLISRLVTLRRSNAKHALAASPEKLERVASAFLANLQSLNTHSTDACFRFISQGESSPTIVKLFPDKPYGPAIEAQIAAIFEAIADGRKNPKTRDRAEKPDYDKLAGELGKLGWAQADLKLFADPAALSKAPPERVCKMVQDWFQAHISINDAGVKERLLHETLRPVIAG